MNNGPVTEGRAREQQTLRLGFDVFCLFPNLVVPTFLQSAVIVTLPPSRILAVNICTERRYLTCQLLYDKMYTLSKYMLQKWRMHSHDHELCSTCSTLHTLITPARSPLIIPPLNGESTHARAVTMSWWLWSKFF